MMKVLATAVLLVSATAFSSSDKSGKADPTATKNVSSIVLVAAVSVAIANFIPAEILAVNQRSAEDAVFFSTRGRA